MKNDTDTTKLSPPATEPAPDALRDDIQPLADFKMKRLYHLVQSVPEAELRRACNRHYRKYAEGLLFAFARLKKIKPLRSNIWQLVISSFEEDGKTCFAVSGVKRSSDERYCFSLSPWPQWLALKVPPSLEQRFSAADIVSHCLYEMTFYGFTGRKIGARRRALNRLSKSDLKGITGSMDELAASTAQPKKDRTQKPTSTEI